MPLITPNYSDFMASVTKQHALNARLLMFRPDDRIIVPAEGV